MTQGLSGASLISIGIQNVTKLTAHKESVARAITAFVSSRFVTSENDLED